MLSRNNLGRFFAAILPVFVLMGSFFVVKISTEISAHANCDGRVAENGQETPGVPDYCEDDTWDDINSTYEEAEFYVGLLRGQYIQKWDRYQSWEYEDGVSCTTDVTQNLSLSNIAAAGYWSGSESKSRAWNDVNQDWVIQISSSTLRYSTLRYGLSTIDDGDGEPLHLICPQDRQDQEGHLLCPRANVDIPEDWDGTWDEGIDWNESLIHEAGMPVHLRKGDESGDIFQCYIYPGNF